MYNHEIPSIPYQKTIEAQVKCDGENSILYLHITVLSFCLFISFSIFVNVLCLSSIKDISHHYNDHWLKWVNHSFDMHYACINNCKFLTLHVLKIKTIIFIVRNIVATVSFWHQSISTFLTEKSKVFSVLHFFLFNFYVEIEFVITYSYLLSPNKLYQ